MYAYENKDIRMLTKVFYLYGGFSFHNFSQQDTLPIKTKRENAFPKEERKNLIQLRIYFFTQNDEPKRHPRSENEVKRRKKGNLSIVSHHGH